MVSLTNTTQLLYRRKLTVVCLWSDNSPCPPKDQLKRPRRRTRFTGSMMAVGEDHAVLDDEKPAHGNIVPMKLAHNKIRVRPSRWHCHCCCVVLDGTGITLDSHQWRKGVAIQRRPERCLNLRESKNRGKDINQLRCGSHSWSPLRVLPTRPRVVDHHWDRGASIVRDHFVELLFLHLHIPMVRAWAGGATGHRSQIDATWTTS